jgi:hypothetical protein
MREEKVHIQTLNQAIDLAKKYSTRGGSIKFENHLNSQGRYSTVNPMDIADMENRMFGLYLFLCHISHELANKKTFELIQDGKTFKITVEEA